MAGLCGSTIRHPHFLHHALKESLSLPGRARGQDLAEAREGIGPGRDLLALVEEEGGTRGPHVPVQGGTGNGPAGPDALRNVQRIKEFAGIDEPIVLPAA
jgi:hypothetical protein